MPDFHSEVIVVGAGAAGATVSWRLASLGVQVACLEQGDWVNPDSYPSTSRDWEYLKSQNYNPNPSQRNEKVGFTTLDEDSPIAPAYFNAVGGSTILYSGHYPRFHPSDFKVSTLDNVASDWPFSYSDLEPYYDLNSTMTAVAGLEGDPAYPQIRNLLPPVPLGKMGEALANGFNKLNWHWWPAYSAIATRAFNGHSACINLGSCNSGCPQGAKSSVDISYWPAAIKLGVQLSTKSTVHSVEKDASNNKFIVNFFDSEGNAHVASATIVVLASNGLGTPRILLNSKSAEFPNGLGNNNDLVGRNLMLHPLGYVEGIFEENLDSQLGPQGCCMASHEFHETSPERQFLRGYTMQVLRGPGPVEFAKSQLTRRKNKWGLEHYHNFESKFDRSAHLSIIVEDLPELHNRVILDESNKDRFGIPLPRIEYTLSENSKKALVHGLQRGKELMKAAGAITTEAFGPVRHTGWHMMGTTKMGLTPATSVINQNFESHEVSNLFVVDSSVFVTSSSVNPANTIQALALMAADKIFDRLKDLKV